MAKQNKFPKTVILIGAIILIIASIYFLETSKQVAVAPNVTTSITSSGVDLSQLKVGSNIGDIAPEIIEGGQWFNINSTSLAELRGKVVIIDFWTYTCINCIRTFPFLKAWYERYEKDGLVIIGVHTPEFGFEKDPANVLQAIMDEEIKWPVIQDNNYATWRSYNNRYWPHKFLIDRDGIIRYDHIGEGGYDETERQIVKLLKETGMEITEMAEQPVVERENLQPTTPEVYVGLARGAFGNVLLISPGINTFTDPGDYRDHLAYLSGKWDVQVEYSQFVGKSNESGELILRYYAKNVNLVLKPQNRIGSFTLIQDGVPLTSLNKGNDITVSNGVSSSKVEVAKLYSLVRNQEYGFHELRFITNSSDFEIYAFTFG